MNSAWLPALGLALVLVVGVVVLLLRGRRAPPPPAVRAPQPPAVQRKPVAAAAPAVPPPDSAVAEIDARRQATTEALRLARPRKADEAARLEAEHAAQARAAAAARTTPPTTPPPPPRPLAPTPAPVVPRPQAGWASRPMGLDPAEPITPRPVPTPAVRPAAAAAPAPVAAPPERALAPPPPLSPPVAPPLRPPAPPRVPVVLVADDSKVVRVKTSRLLEKQGWQVLLADDGAAALQLLDGHTPDLLITDVEMPGVDGFTLTREVRSHARCARLPVIMITSSDERHRAEAQAVGVDLLLGKPYAEETLLAQAQRLLGLTAPALH